MSENEGNTFSDKEVDVAMNIALDDNIIVSDESKYEEFLALYESSIEHYRGLIRRSIPGEMTYFAYGKVSPEEALLKSAHTAITAIFNELCKKKLYSDYNERFKDYEIDEAMSEEVFFAIKEPYRGTPSYKRKRHRPTHGIKNKFENVRESPSFNWQHILDDKIIIGSVVHSDYYDNVKAHNEYEKFVASERKKRRRGTFRVTSFKRTSPECYEIIEVTPEGHLMVKDKEGRERTIKETRHYKIYRPNTE